ncbi:peptidase of plants and bacteria-domain-containing protein [Cladorrhinum samala]|uniref:Peptidase of plants and bacteria-domain-containing protein n=1 Tax=Cladorrhinum samala TaxID=585594 RepID=A0AAV9HBU3_9PEZI|nr:peptidase of plants and bacteria-domain-containing protein [Cladorrhinum samala]
MTCRSPTSIIAQNQVSYDSTMAAKPAPSAVPTPLPDRTRDTDSSTQEEDPTSFSQESFNIPHAPPAFSKPKLRLEIRDLDHPGSSKFLSSINLSTVFTTAVNNVLRLLYHSPSDKHTAPPPTRSVTLILRDIDGVAYTTGTELDSDHKEIHFSLSYINSIRPDTRLAHEITGVLTHELVHCYQWNAKGTCPGGLIEGIADWVRLNCDLSPPHWKKEYKGDWDQGYQHTAYFLQYLEQRFGLGTVRQLNEKLRQHKYKESSFWTELLGSSVTNLYGDYVKANDGKSLDENSNSKGGNNTTVDEGTQT